MRKRVCAAWACLFLLPFLSGVEAAQSENSCVNCHRDLPANTFIGAKYQSWKESLHAREMITCDRCHGGNPSAAQKETAHTGVYNSGNSSSRIYYKNVPGTCGACHRRDYNFFTRSAHYAFLEKTGAGPTCVTCHESHSTRIISPQQLPATCEQCHNERRGIKPQVPAQAQILLLAIDETSLLARVGREQGSKSDPKRIKEWREISGLMGTIRDEWHAFNLGQVQKGIFQVYDRIKRLLLQEK